MTSAVEIDVAKMKIALRMGLLGCLEDELRGLRLFCVFKRKGAGKRNLAPRSRAHYFLCVLEPVVVMRWPGALSECPGPAAVLLW
ncbi:hypothetical protein [Bradyrhizobium sp. SZCCHNR1098]|uniref:hypothetical protein n=1 Tax=Bradyrhizobium sp. SZCCHNR1098 TaxID=3057370 RepID=UPI002916F826|nr:hypothetical protein [Bradyrhizobium sp. SZCCHNR1098]